MASGFPPGDPQIRKTHMHVIPFQDHAGKPALTIFESSSPLPFLYSYSVYFTHPDVSPNTSYATELYQTVTQGPLYHSNTAEYRLDLYFLPDGSQDNCIAHYCAEKSARGNFRAQIDAVGSNVRRASTKAHNSGQMPGLVPSYAIHDKARYRYHSLAYVCSVSDWRDGDQLLTCVEFDPLSREEYEEFSKDPEDPREPDVLPDTQVKPETLSESSPGYGRELPRPFFAVRAMQATLWERVPRERFGQEAWQEARNRGWTTW